MVMVLIGILAVTARAAFVKQGDFAATLVKNQFISSLRLAQQAALAKSDGIPVTFTASLVGGDARFGVSHDAESSSRQVDAAGTTIHWSTTSLSGSCAGVTGSLPHMLTYSSEGDTAKTRFCIVGEQTYKVCVSGLGFAYEGDCES